MSLHPALSNIVADPRMTVRVPPESVPFPVIRKAANAAMATGPRPELPLVKDYLVQANYPVPIRIYCPQEAELRVIVFCHGGGFVWGSLDTHDGLCRRMAARTGAIVVSVDYRLSPESPFPAAQTDLSTVVDVILASIGPIATSPDHLTLCGDSAGGYLAFLETSRLVRTERRPATLGLFYPALDPSCTGESHVTNAEGPILTTEAMRWFWSCHAPASNDPAYLDAPLDAFPPTHVLVAGHDPLRDDGAGLHAALVAAGTPASLIQAPDMVHGFLNLPLPHEVTDKWENRIFDALGAD